MFLALHHIHTTNIALCTFIGLWVMFLDPADDAFAKGFTLSLSGAPVAGFIVALIGVSILVPFPFWAMDKARGSAKGAAKEVCKSWEAVIQLTLDETYVRLRLVRLHSFPEFFELVA